MHAEEGGPGKRKPTLWERLMSHWVEIVPDDIAHCEFNCSKTDCSNSEWKNCKRRIDPLNPSLTNIDPLQRPTAEARSASDAVTQE
jgi:hypothetical protein